MTKQQAIAQGNLQTEYVLEFRTWNGSAYVWTDYTDRLMGHGDIAFQIERQAIPNAFSSSINSLRLRNDDHFFDDINVLDGVLVNSSEPYGKYLYKRIVRISSVDDVLGGTETKVIFVGRIIEVENAMDGLEVVCKLASMDVVSKDQNCDSAVAQRHPLGSDDSSAPSPWTVSAPAATGEVAMYRFRQLEDEQQTYSFGWFKHKKVSDVLTRMSWALDDLDTDIEDITVYTEDEREICSSRSVPPDDSSVFDGPPTPSDPGDMRTRASCWNDNLNELVLGVGNKIYAYRPNTNLYILRYTLTSTYQVVFMQYIEKADTNGVVDRIVIVALDTSVITTPSTLATGAGILNAPAYITVLDASDYSLPSGAPNGVSLGSDFYPATHMTTAGIWFLSETVRAFGHINDTTAPATDVDAGENAWLPFEQTVYQKETTDVAYPFFYGYSQNAVNDSSDTGLDSVHAEATENRVSTVGGEVFGTGFMNLATHVYPTAPAGDPGPLWARWTWGQRVQAAIHLQPSGGKLYFFTFDETNQFRMKTYNLFSYSAGSYIAAPTFGTVPVPVSIGTNDSDITTTEVHTFWLRTSADPNPWEAGYFVYNTSTPAWATVVQINDPVTLYTNDLDFWTILEFTELNVSTPPKVVALLYNRASQKYAIAANMRNVTASASLLAEFLTFNGVTQQPNKLTNLHVNENYSPDRVFWVEMGSGESGGAGGAVLWSWDGTTVRAENKTPADSNTVIPGDPISSDQGITCIAHTGTNYPDSNTPNGMMFLITCNDFEHGSAHAAGFYGLVQFCNFHSGFVKLLDLSGLSFFAARSALAAKMGAVHFYSPDGTFTFKERNAVVGAASFTFSLANKNYTRDAKIVSQGWEEVRTEVKMLPYAIVAEQVLGDIIKGQSESPGTLDNVSVALDPFERAEWQVVFTSTTEFDVYKLSGDGSSSTAKASSDINSVLRDIPDGPYLSFSPDNWSATFYKGDTFRFFVYPARESMQQLDDRDAVFIRDTTAEANWQRRHADISSRFVEKREAPDFAQAYLDWVKNPHPVVRIQALYDPGYLPLLDVKLTDAFAFTTSDNFRFIAVRHSSDRMHSFLDLQKI